MSYDQSEITKAVLQETMQAVIASQYPREFEILGTWSEVFENDTYRLPVRHLGTRKRVESSFEYLSDRRSEPEITQDAEKAVEWLRHPATRVVQVFNGGIRAIDESGSPVTSLTTSAVNAVTANAAALDPHSAGAATPMEKPPKAFISYTWEDPDHVAWVKSFATRLRNDGVEVTLDQWHAALGDQLTEFMERAIRENDFVLVICTPKYKSKSDQREGGVGYEGDVMTAEVNTARNRRKFIPVRRKGEWAKAAPSWLLGSRYVDLCDDPYSEEAYNDLMDALHGTQEVPPPVGSRPSQRTPADPAADEVNSTARDPLLDRTLAVLKRDLTIVNTALVAHDMPQFLREELADIAKSAETAATMDAAERLRERLEKVNQRHNDLFESRKPRSRRTL